MSDNYDDAFDNKRFSGIVLKKALTEVLSSLGPTWRETIFEDMRKHGMNFDSNAKYSITDISQYLYAVFEKDMGEVILDKLREQLRKID